LDNTQYCVVSTSHIDWHLKLYIVTSFPSFILLTDFDIGRGLAIVFAEDIPDVAKQNPVTGVSFHGRKI